MSYYLYFRKNGIDLCNFGRHSALYNTFCDVVSWEGWKSFSNSDLLNGKKGIENHIKCIDKRLKNYEKVLDKIVDFDERMDACEAMNELEEDKERYYQALIQIDMLLRISEPDYTEIGDEKFPVMEWGIF